MQDSPMRDDTRDESKRIPMRELEKLTNFTRATINFYIREGILPFPQKSARNMAYYDDEFIQKLDKIRLLKKSGFSLIQIKQIMNTEKEPDPDMVLGVLNQINALLPYERAESTVSLDQILGIGYDREMVKHLIELKIISPTREDPNTFPSYCLAICRFTKYFLDAGIPLVMAKEVIKKLIELTNVEKNAFDLYIRQPLVVKNATPEEQTRAIQNCVENINALLPLLHLQLLKQTAESILNTK
jgi:DNA-binding transcriptional MerR regulator